MNKRRVAFGAVVFLAMGRAATACDDSSSSSSSGGFTFDSGTPTFDATTPTPTPTPDASTTDAGTDGAPQLLTTGVGAAALELIVRGGNLYWLDGTTAFSPNEVRTCSIDGCAAPKTLVTEPNIMYLRNVASDGTSVFYTVQKTASDATVMKVDIATADGGAGTLLSDELTQQPWNIVAAGGRIYWLNYFSGDLVTCDPANCAATRSPIGNGGPRADGLDVTGTALFWVGEGNPASQSFATTCNLPSCDGGTTQLMYPGQNARQLRVAPPNFYYLNLDTLATKYELRTCPITGCPDGGPALKVSSDETELATQTLAANADKVYWVNAGRIVSCPAGGCDGGAAQPHATLPNGETPLLLAADATYVYAITTQGSLWRVPK